MNRLVTSKNRKQIQAKMEAALGENIQSLPTEFKKILIDDLVTAFENRLTVLKCAQTNTPF